MTRKRISLVAMLLLWQIVHPVAAQAPSDAATPMAREAMRAHAQKLWDTYRGAGRGGEQALSEIMATRSFPATRENAAAVLAVLNSKASRDERIWLVRLAGHLHLRLSNDAQAQADIRGHLTGLATNTDDAALGKVAALTYSSIGYFPDSLAVLARARSRSFITDNDYFGDVAHLFPDAPAVEQTKLLQVLRDGNNSYSREIFANYLKSKDVLKALTPEATLSAIGFLGKEEPAFSAPANAVGGGDLLRYEEWLSATVALNAQATREPERIVMARMLKVDGADPRKLIATLLSESSSALVRDAMDRSTLNKIDAAIAGFAAQNSRNAWIQEVAASARANLAEPKK